MFDKFKYSKRVKRAAKLLAQGLCPFCKKELNFYLIKNACICPNCGILPNIKEKVSFQISGNGVEINLMNPNNKYSLFWQCYFETGAKHKGQ